jgi:arabinogalactan endo-1,4-beta-galactosidase
MVKKAFSAVLTVLALICSAFLPSFAAQSGKIDFNNPDFIRGMDISSVLSLEQSGVKFYDEKGRLCVSCMASYTIHTDKADGPGRAL